MFHQQMFHNKLLPFCSRVRTRALLAGFAAGYILCISAMILYTSSSSGQEIHKNSEFLDYGSTAKAMSLRQRRMLHSVGNTQSAGTKSEIVGNNGIHHTISDIPRQMEPPVINRSKEYSKLEHSELEHPKVEHPKLEHSADSVVNSVIQETFTSYQFDDNDAVVNTIPKPQVQKRNRGKALTQGHRKVKRRRQWLNTPPVVTNLDGNPVTGMAS